MMGDRVTIIGVPSTRGDAWSPEAVKARGAIARRIQQHEKNLMVLLRKIFGETK